jgi:hypothetical protein
MEKLQSLGAREKIIDKTKAGESIARGWDYMLKQFDTEDVHKITTEISKSIFNAYENNAFILPKSEQDILSAISEGRLVAIVGYDKSMQKRFIAASCYNIIGYQNDVPLIEVGGLISNSNVTTRKDFSGLKELVYPINEGGVWKNGQSYGALVLDAVIAKIKQNHPSFQIIATTRGIKSQKALYNAGFMRVDWSPEVQQYSCDPNCRGVENHVNCSLANKVFTDSDDSGCQLMQY